MLQKKKLNTTFSCIISKMFVSLFQRNIAMTFDKILENNALWAVRYDGEADNSLRMVFNQWNDPE